MKNADSIKINTCRAKLEQIQIELDDMGQALAAIHVDEAITALSANKRF